MSDLPVMVGRQVSPGEMLNTKNLKRGIKGAQESADVAQAAADAAMASIPAKCTGVEIDIGTDDAKFSTPKAIADSSLAFLVDIPSVVEGTWTPTITFGGASTGITYNNAKGYYLKVANTVFATGYIALSSKGSATGAALIGGLPSTIINVNRGYSPVNLWLDKITFANAPQGYGIYNTKTIYLGEITEAGVTSALTDADFANDSAIMLSFMYRAL